MAYTIKFWDETSMVVTDEQGEAIKQTLISKAEIFTLKDNLYKVAAVASVTKGGHLPPAAHDRRIEAPKAPAMTDQQRAKNLERIQAIRRNLLERKRV